PGARDGRPTRRRGARLRRRSSEARLPDGVGGRLPRERARLRAGAVQRRRPGWDRELLLRESRVAARPAADDPEGKGRPIPSPITFDPNAAREAATSSRWAGIHQRAFLVAGERRPLGAESERSTTSVRSWTSPQRSAGASLGRTGPDRWLAAQPRL